eukprot:14935703-Alexandrium_andersonii.AAC.1
MPDEATRRATLELGHDATIVVSDEEDNDAPEADPDGLNATWPAQRRVVEAVTAAGEGREFSDSSSGEEVPDWGGSESEGE